MVLAPVRTAAGMSYHAYVKLTPALSWSVGSPPRPLDARMLPLLDAIAARGSLSAAVKHVGLSYRAAWGLLRDYETSLGTPLVDLARGHAAVLAPAGERLLQAHRAASERFALLARDLAFDVGPVRAPRHAPRAVLRVAASHDLALAAIHGSLAQAAGLSLDLSVMGSLAALQAFDAGTVDLAGFHVPIATRRSARADLGAFRAFLRSRRDRLIAFVEREQGLMLGRSHARHVRTLRDVAARGLTFVNRQRGSGTRLVIDALLRREAIDPTSIRGYTTEEFTHRAVAATVASGGADAGFGLRAAADEYDLAFVPLLQEKYHLAVRASALRRAPLTALVAYLESSAFAAIVQRLPGYRAPMAGEILSIDSL